MADTAKLSINDLPNGKVAVIGGADGPTEMCIRDRAWAMPLPKKKVCNHSILTYFCTNCQ